MHKKVDIIYVSEYIVSRCMSLDKPVTNLYLQKILYLVEKKYISLYGDSLFNKDIYAWKFGPVFEDVYYHYSDYGSMAIINLDDNDGKEISKEVRLIINNIIDKVIDLQPYELVKLVQFKGSAWDKNYSNYRKCNISTQDILKEID